MIFESSFPKIVISEIPVGTRILEKIGIYGDRIALVNGDTGNEITFSEIKNDIINYSTTLWSLGVRKGHVIILFVPLDPDYIALLIAIAICGAIFLVSDINKDDLISHIEEINPYLIVTHSGYSKPRVECKVFTMPEIRDYKSTFDPKTSVFPFGLMIDVHEDPIAIFPSSGTTGKLKGIVHTHYSINTAIDQIDGLQVDQSSCEVVSMLRHHYASTILVFKRLFAGVKVVLLPDLTTSNMYKLVQKHKASVLTTTNAVAMLDFIKNAKAQELETLILIRIGGMPFPSHMIHKARTELNITMTCLYGTSEAGYISTGHSNKCPINSVGKLLSNIKVRIIDLANKNDLKANESGEILFKSPTLMKEYLNPKGDDHFAKDSAGWFHTGDVGYIDQNGYLYIKGRIKICILGLYGVPIYPAEMEAILLKHPYVKDAAVISVKDLKFVEAAKAYVVRGSESADSDDILAFYNKQVPGYKQINGGLEFIKVIPRVGLGKINRRELLKLHEKLVGKVK